MACATPRIPTSSAVPAARLCGLLVALVAGLLVALPAGQAQADTVYLKSGDRISGSLIRFRADRLNLTTDYAGEVNVVRSAMAALATDDVVTVVFKDGARAVGRLRVSWPTQMFLVVDAPYSYQAVSLAQIDAIFPGDGTAADAAASTADVFVWEGRVNFGFENKSGNTDKTTLDIDGQVTGRSEQNRVTARGEVDIEDASNERVTQKAQGQVRHDRFRTERFFEYTSVFAEYDKFKSLSLRLLATTGPGFQFLEGEQQNLSTTLGIAYLHEDFSDARDTNTAAGNWSLDYDVFVYRRLAQFFHFQQGTLNFEDTGQLILSTRTGFRFPILDGFNTTVQLDVDYESRPAPGRRETDTAFKISLGYNW